MIKHSFLTLLLLYLFIFRVQADQEIKTDNEKPVRPKVGLVLSGGGAKGFVYVGLFRALQEAGLHIDYIGGTSIGSIMASLYAVGYSPDAIEQMIRSQDWDMVLKDEVARRFVAFEEKEFMEKSIITLPYKKRKIGLKSSLYRGQQVNLLLNKYLSPAYDIKDFSHLPTPFLCVGTDLLTGEAVTLKTGYLPNAVRASMSIPGYFSPMEYNGKYLVDGGVVDNYPARQVQEMGAQLIIGGNVQSGLTHDINNLHTITAVLDQVISFTRVPANEEAFKIIDLNIQYHVSQGIMDFTMYDSIIAYGERVARQHYDKIKKLADSLNAIEYVPLKEFNAKPLDKVFIRKVIYIGKDRMSTIFLDNFFEKMENSEVKLEEIEETVTRLYGTRFFQHVYYELEPLGNGEANLIINLLEGDPGYFSASLRYDNDYEGSVLVSAVFRNILGNRSKLFSSLILGPNPRFKMLYLISNGPKVGPGLELDFYSFRFDYFDKDVKVNTLRFINYKTSVFASSVVDNLYRFRAGVQLEYFSLKPEIPDETLKSMSDFNAYASGFVSFKTDTRDKPYYSTTGFESNLNVSYIFPLGNNWSRELFTNSFMYYLNYNQNLRLTKRFTLKPGTFLGGTLRQDLPPIQHWFGVGGLMPINYMENLVPFTGVSFVQSIGLYSAIARLKLQYNVYKNLYLTARSDLGSNEMELDDLIKSENIMFGYGLTFGYYSFIGPIEVTVMGSNINSAPGLFFNVGFEF
ncbi:MAG: patatin-like phospholipase family protein [Bacteroidetes bacterium]|nr:patatin-like phospholipase family protein [Bacteroidota bacterium]